MDIRQKLNNVLVANIGARIYLTDKEAELLFNDYRLSQPTKRCCDDLLVYGYFEWNERPMRLAQDNQDRYFVTTF